MKLFSGILFCLFISVTSGCDFIDDKLVVRNNTDSAIIFLISEEPRYFPTTTDPDTVLDKKINDSLFNTRAKIRVRRPMRGVHFASANSSENISLFNTTWEGVIDRLPGKRIEFFFFSPHVLTSGIYTWKEIWSNKMYLQKKDFSKAEMKKNDWVVFFDGK